MGGSLTLRAGGWEAVLRPEEGAAMAALRHAGTDLLVPVPEGQRVLDGFHGAFLMVPWTNRLDAGRLPVGGVVHRMPVNRPADNTAIHGLARDLPFAVERAGAAEAVLVQRLDHPPFRITTRVEAALDGAGLRLGIAVVNEAPVAVPVGLGWHPFFRRPAGTRIRFAATHVLGHDARTLPTTARRCAGIAGDEPAYLGLDHHAAGWDGVAEFRFPGGAAHVLRAAGAASRNLHIFAPRHAAVLCLEPVSHAPDAPNRAASAAHGAMEDLAPGMMRATSLMIHSR